MARDRDVRSAIQAALVATGVFDGVYLSGPPESQGFSTEILAAAVIEPEASTQRDLWDADSAIAEVVTSRVQILFMFRNEDPQVRDEGVELLVNIAQNALNGQSLAGLTLPDLTKFTGWSWIKPNHPERRIKSMFSYQYLADPWTAFDSST